ncbi:MAG: methyltransferase domain-containing protein [Vicinamibacterales bacterium]
MSSPVLLSLVGRIRRAGELMAAGVGALFSNSANRKTFLLFNSAELGALARQLSSTMPQASLSETDVQCDVRDWRLHFTSQLSGTGLEIGALYKPMPLHDGMTVRHVDHGTSTQLRAWYPELASQPLVEPDVVDDASSLTSIADASVDFVIAAHVIEHLRDPIGALAAWCRVVRPGGHIYIVVPDKRFSFDRHRVRTTLEHLILDHRRPSEDRDFEHYLEYASLVHGAAGDAALDEAERLRATNHSIHFHVFMPSDVVALLHWFARTMWPVTMVERPATSPHHDEFHVLLQVTAR